MSQLTTVGKSIFESIFHSSTLGILVVNEQGTIVAANPHLEQRFGYEPNELLEQPLETLVPIAFQNIHQQLRKGFFAHPQARPMGHGRYLYGQCKNGTEFPIEVSLCYAELENQRYAIAYLSDVTEKQEAGRLNILLTRLFQESLHATYVIDTSTLRFVRANQAALDSLGYSLPELRQLHPWDIKLDTNQAVFQQIIAPILTEEVSKVTFETTFVRKDGTTFPVEVHFQAFQHNHTRVFMQIVLDISERKQTEQRLIREKEIAQRYLDVANAIFVLINEDQTVALINQKGCELLGYSEQEIIGKNWFNHFIPQRVREEILAIFNQAMAGQVSPIEYVENWILTRDKEERLIEWHNTILRDDCGKPTATLSSGIDITNKRKAEQAVNQALVEGQEAERRRVAQELHDGLSQSLTAIRLHLNAFESDVAHSAKKNQEAFEKLKHILQTTTQEVKDISRDLMPSVLRDYGLVKALQFLCQTVDDTNQVKLHFQTYGLTQEPDESRKVGLYRIAQELINNTLKHAQAQKIDLQLIEHPDSIVLSVEDNGRGFTPSESKEHSHGFGLKNIETRVKLLSGTFTIDSSPKQGTLVTVEIPKPTNEQH